ncbi:zinc finger protein 705A-like isoform X3 [Protopterus annectens]|uniref:zinc finger protein 705A-like isoform X3 n=1 Tax=Protopterus annectens TaxID=7888 RepID=UPI001CFA30BE|nr:zinc finger protein 705A-like isoform X3 [Protopterus annectens]
MKLEMPEAFEDVAVDFSREEWKMLCNQEKELYKEVMMQNYEHMVSVGFNVPIEQLLLLIEKQEELLPDSVERAVTLLQKNSCDEPSVMQKSQEQPNHILPSQGMTTLILCVPKDVFTRSG